MCGGVMNNITEREGKVPKFEFTIYKLIKKYFFIRIYLAVPLIMILVETQAQTIGDFCTLYIIFILQETRPSTFRYSNMLSDSFVRSLGLRQAQILFTFENQVKKTVKTITNFTFGVQCIQICRKHIFLNHNALYCGIITLYRLY